MVRNCFISALLAASLLLEGASARRGADLSVHTTTDTWRCLVNSFNVSYAFVRAYRNVGAVDTNATDSLKAASEAGIQDLHAYIFPCSSGSAYSASKNITCATPADQFRAVLSALEEAGISVERTSKISSKSKSGTVIVKRIWLDIEDESPSKYFDTNVANNVALLSEMASTAKEEGVYLGIYTTKTYWSNIMGNVEGYSIYPLW
jgi:hypothetical protein